MIQGAVRTHTHRLLGVDLWIALGFALWVGAPSAGAETLRAEQITEHTAPRLLIGGTDAIGGIGDWYLANDVVEIIVDDPSRAYATQNHGGTIVDAGRIDRHGEDQFGRFFSIINMNQQVAPGFDTIRAEVDPNGAWARIVVTNSKGPEVVLRGEWSERINPMLPDPAAVRDVHIETEYRVVPGEPFVQMTTLFRNDGDLPAPIFAYGDVWMRGGRSMRAFSGNTQNSATANGFHHTGFSGNSLFDAGGVIRPFDYLVVPGMRNFTPIGYAIFSPERIARGLVHFGVTSEHISLVNAVVGDPGWTELGLTQMFETTQQELGAGASWTYRRRLLVTGRPDVASATDVIFPLLGVADGSAGIQGWVEPPGVACSVQVDAADTGAPLTQIMVETEGPGAGRYRATLPPGPYRLTLRAPHREPSSVEATVLPGRFTEVDPQRLPESAWLTFERNAFAAGPGRVVVSGIRGSPDPVFEPELLDFLIDASRAESGTETNEIHFLGNGNDPQRVAIAPGNYRLTATRGLEHEIEQVEVELPQPGSAAAVPPFALKRVASTRGFLSADLHVHAEASDDSGISNLARLRSFVADGVDVMISTDHDHIGNFDDAIEALALRDRIIVINGVEVTSSTGSEAAPYTIGHQNAWPIPYRPFVHRKGAPPSQHLTVAELYASLRRDYGAEVVQLNHPRPKGEDGENPPGNFWSHMGSVGGPFDPTIPVDAAPNDVLLAPASDGSTRGIDFDAVELMNGASRLQYERVRKDWHSLLRQGFPRTATANSDTHGPSEVAGYPRNFVRVQTTNGSWDENAFNAAIRAGRLFGTNGPIITRFTVNGGSMGDLVRAPAGRTEVEMEVVAASWVPVDEVRLIVNGEIERLYSVATDPGGPELRFSRSVVLDLHEDAFITLEAGAPLGVDQDAWVAGHPGPYTEVIAPNFVTTAFANPIFVDVDGNSSFDAPGLEPRSQGKGPVLLGMALLAVVWWIRRRRARSPRQKPELAR